MSLSPPSLVALVCPECGVPLDVAQESEVFACRRCDRAYELTGDELRRCPVFTAGVTSRSPGLEEPRYVAVWRFAAHPSVREKSTTVVESRDVWSSIERVAAPEPACLYVPSFTLARVAVQQLGILLVESQPRLRLTPGVPPEHPSHRPLVGAPGGGSVAPSTSGRARGAGVIGGYAAAVAEAGLADGPGFATVSPVVFGEADARAVAHFVYLALESLRTPELRSIDYDLELEDAELLFIPACYDARYVRHANWRLLLSECDGSSG